MNKIHCNYCDAVIEDGLRVLIQKIIVITNKRAETIDLCNKKCLVGYVNEKME